MNSKSQTNIRWQCRRGMLELDLLLNNFVDKKAESLTQSQYQVFEQLLSYPDQTLHDLLLGNAVSSDSSLDEIVRQIRSTSYNPNNS